VSTLRQRATLVDALGSSLTHGGTALGQVPGLLRRVLQEDAWREFETKLGKHVQHERFADFVTTPPLAGLGASMDLLRRIAKDDPELTRLLRQIEEPMPAHGEIGRARGSNTTSSGRGETYALRRLKRDRSDLAQRVIDGELSPHAAAVEAGFRKPTFTVPKAGPERIAQYLRRHLDDDTLRAVSKLLDQDGA
jgi:hypothetical protein